MHNHCFKLLITLFLSIGLSSSLLSSDRPELIHLSDLRTTAQQAKAKKLPILIMFGTDECPYCEMLKEEFLIPMLISGDYEDKVILREADIDAGDSIINFSGKKISIDEFRDHYGVKLYPTMVLVDHEGKQLVEKIVGITTPSLFGGTIDDRIDEALHHTRTTLHGK